MVLKLSFAAGRNRREHGAAIAAHDPRHRILLKLYTRHCLLDLRLADDTAAQSAIIELVPEAGYFVLDQPVPHSALTAVDSDAPVAVRARLDGRDVQFETRIVQSGGSTTRPFYKALYPDLVDFPQRRREYRVTVPLERAQAVRMRDADLRLHGELRDLSPGGFSARITYDGFGRLERALGWRAQCEIDLDDDHAPFTATVEICHVVPPRGRTLGRIGTCFVDLDTRAERRIERYVALLERQRARLR